MLDRQSARYQGECPAAIGVADEQQSLTLLTAAAGISNDRVSIAWQLLSLGRRDAPCTELDAGSVRGEQLGNRVGHLSDVYRMAPTAKGQERRNVYAAQLTSLRCMSEAVRVTELRRDLSAYVRRAGRGERLLITRGNRPIAELGPVPVPVWMRV